MQNHDRPCEKTSFAKLFRCLSRACLGKKFVSFLDETWLHKKAVVFHTVCEHVQIALDAIGSTRQSFVEGGSGVLGVGRGCTAVTDQLHGRVTKAVDTARFLCESGEPAEDVLCRIDIRCSAPIEGAAASARQRCSIDELVRPRVARPLVAETRDPALFDELSGRSPVSARNLCQFLFSLENAILVNQSVVSPISIKILTSFVRVVSKVPAATPGIAGGRGAGECRLRLAFARVDSGPVLCRCIKVRCTRAVECAAKGQPGHALARGAAGKVIAELGCLNVAFDRCDSLFKNASLFELSLCLSRACLGKMIIFSIEWRKKMSFLTLKRSAASQPSRLLNMAPLLKPVLKTFSPVSAQVFCESHSTRSRAN
jgi:hypothetical protein